MHTHLIPTYQETHPPHKQHHTPSLLSFPNRHSTCEIQARLVQLPSYTESTTPRQRAAADLTVFVFFYPKNPLDS